MKQNEDKNLEQSNYLFYVSQDSFDIENSAHYIDLDMGVKCQLNETIKQSTYWQNTLQVMQRIYSQDLTENFA